MGTGSDEDLYELQEADYLGICVTDCSKFIQWTSIEDELVGYVDDEMRTVFEKENYFDDGSYIATPITKRCACKN